MHEAVVAHHATGWMALDLHADDVFWCTADPGWVTGTSLEGILSASPRLTGNAPRPREQPGKRPAKQFHLPTRARSAGMCSGPEMRSRNQSRSGGVSSSDTAA